MVSVMNNEFDFDSSRSGVDGVRVSNDGFEGVESGRDEEIRVMTEMGETRVLSGCGQDGDDGRVLGGSDSGANGDSRNVVDGDGEIKFRGRDAEELRDARNEVGVVSSSDDRGRGSSVTNFDAAGNEKRRGRNASNDGMKMKGMAGEFRLERHGDLWGSVGGNVGACDTNAVVRAGSLKVLGSDFEMGDMVWAKVKSHPWWPGHIFNEAFVSSSVRRTRRDGNVLVAFFGDSSYGWFDPSELVPYDEHYGEKSQQTSSRNFMRAVEESVDEASRRSALGLSCRCRNPYNFRPTNVPGHVAVDVVDCEPGAIYSVSQIQRARDSFQPLQTLSFIKQLAAGPMSGDSKSLDFIQQKATALAYRRSIFEEFDETYAQAFGQEPVRQLPLPQTPTDKEPSQAVLSGPHVVAEALVGRKSLTKASKPKDLSKKDRYLFKRRDETGDSRKFQITQVNASSSSSSAYKDGTSDSAAASFVLQKRDHTSSTSPTSARDQVATSAQVITKDAPPTGFDVMVDPYISGKKVSIGGTSSSQSSTALTAEVSNITGLVPDSHMSSIMSTDAGLVKKKKKKKVAKRPAGQLSSEHMKSDISQKKLRKTDAERSVEHSERLPSGSGENLVKPAGRSLQVTGAPGEDFQISNQKKGVEVVNSVPQQVGSLSLEVAGESEVQLPQMLADLRGLALNPFHGAERNRPAIAWQFFLKFRSLVFLKASSALSIAELEPSEVGTVRSPSAADPTDKPPTDGIKTVSSLKSSKLSARLEDPKKGARKRLPSERQEEIAAKRAKKITEVKSLGAEKKALLKNPEMLRADGKTKVAAAQHPSSKPMKAEQQTKKMDRPPRVEEPTYLVMKFQSGSSLPSLVELKARFARFGPLDTTLSRVFYKTNTCRVAFLFKQDANVAYRYAVGSKSLFANVKFMLRPVATPEPLQPSSSRTEDLLGDPPSIRDSPAADPKRPGVPASPSMQQQPVTQLKSCLKKPLGGDELTGPTNGSSSASMRTPRVRFNVGEDKEGASSRDVVVQVQMESRNPVSVSEGAGASCLSSPSVAMDVVINNQRFMSALPLEPPSLPHPPQFARTPIILPQQHVEVGPINNFNFNPAVTTGPPGLTSASPPPTHSPAPPPPPSTDISQQMMNLLKRCHDVVTNVQSILGYIPYHPL